MPFLNHLNPFLEFFFSSSLIHFQLQTPKLVSLWVHVVLRYLCSSYMQFACIRWTALPLGTRQWNLEALWVLDLGSFPSASCCADRVSPHKFLGLKISEWSTYLWHWEFSIIIMRATGFDLSYFRHTAAYTLVYHMSFLYQHSNLISVCGRGVCKLFHGERIPVY